MMNVAERTRSNAPAEAQRWLASFEAALQAQDAAAAAALFRADGLWRDLLAFTWTIETASGRAAIEKTLRATLARTQAKEFSHSAAPHAPRWISRAGTECIEALFEFETALGPCNGALRLVPDDQGRLRAWTLNTNLHELRGHEEEFKRRAEPDSTRDFGAENWRDRLERQRAFADRDPVVLVVGGGHAGLSIAARLSQLGIDTLIVDRHKRIGDNWRTRYHSLTLHNEVFVNHLPYLPFPPNFPVYIPKDRLANWFEFYVEAMELNFWTGTELVSGSYDEQAQAMVGHAQARRRRNARDASAPFDLRHRRVQHSHVSRSAGLKGLRRHRGAFRRLRRCRAMEGPQGAGARHRHQRP